MVLLCVKKFANDKIQRAKNGRKTRIGGGRGTEKLKASTHATWGASRPLPPSPLSRSRCVKQCHSTVLTNVLLTPVIYRTLKTNNISPVRGLNVYRHHVKAFATFQGALTSGTYWSYRLKDEFITCLWATWRYTLSNLLSVNTESVGILGVTFKLLEFDN